MGSGQREIWRFALYLRDAGFVSGCAGHCGPALGWSGRVHDRNVPQGVARAAVVLRGIAGGDSQRHLRTLGDVRASSSPEHEGGTIPRQDPGLDGTLHRGSVRNRHAGGGNHPGDHDHPHHFVDHSRSAAGRTATAEGRRARARRHALGDDSRRRFAQCARGNSWRNHSRTGPGARRNHGSDHGDRKPSRNCQVAVRSRIHHGQRAGQ